jgi:hypothetical protein
MSTETSQTSSSYKLPKEKCLIEAAKQSIVEDKPIMMDYWTDSLEKKVIIGVKGDDEKLLVKTEDEYTSPILNIYKVGTEYLIITQNSIYVVSASIDVKRVSPN